MKRTPLFLNFMFVVREAAPDLQVQLLCSLLIVLSNAFFYLIIFSFPFDHYDHFNNEPVLNNAVKSNELKWLPNGSEFPLATENTTSTSTSTSTSKPKTYASFSCSQDSLPEFSNKSIGPKHPDITIARLGPGQVILLIANIFIYCIFEVKSQSVVSCYSNQTSSKGLPCLCLFIALVTLEQRLLRHPIQIIFYCFFFCFGYKLIIMLNSQL